MPEFLLIWDEDGRVTRGFKSRKQSVLLCCWQPELRIKPVFNTFQPNVHSTYGFSGGSHTLGSSCAFPGPGDPGWQVWAGCCGEARLAGGRVRRKNREQEEPRRPERGLHRQQSHLPPEVIPLGQGNSQL